MTIQRYQIIGGPYSLMEVSGGFACEDMMKATDVVAELDRLKEELEDTREDAFLEGWNAALLSDFDRAFATYLASYKKGEITMELKTKYPWTVVSPTHVFNKYGDFRKYGDAFLFFGSYLTHRWIKYWYGERLVGTDLGALMKIVEKKISHYKWNQRFFRALMTFVVLLVISCIAVTLYIWFLKLSSEAQ